MTTSIRDFRPSIFGKLNTVSQVAAVYFVLLFNVSPMQWIYGAKTLALYATFAFTTFSGIHYVLLTGERLHQLGQAPKIEDK
jgi:cardiolipin synthase